jgi:O-antigen/teichoic acid export membrane protein
MVGAAVTTEIPEGSSSDPDHVAEPPTPPPFLGGRLRLGQAAFVGVYADVALAVLSLALVPYLIAKLGTEPYGILGIVSMLGGQLVILHAGIGTAATRLVSESVARGGEGLVSRLTGIAVVSAAAALAVGLVFLVGAPLAWRHGFNVSSLTLPIALAAVPAGAAFIALAPAVMAVQGVLIARERFLFAAVLRFYQGAGRLLGAVAVVTLGGGVVGVIWIQAAIDVTAVGLGWVRCASGVGEPAGVAAPRTRSLRREIAGVITTGLPFALVGLLSGLLVDAEKLAIGLARSVADFTYYTVPFNAVIKFTVFSGAVWRVLMPRVSRLCAEGKQSDARALTERADRILAVATLGILAPVVAVTPELLQLWVGPEFVAHSTLATRLLILGVGVNALAFPAGAVAAGSGRPAHLNYLYAGELVLHLVSVYVLVTSFGLSGAALAWALRVTLDTFAQRVLAERALRQKLTDGFAVWGPLGVLAGLVAAAPVLPLVARVGIGGVIAVACLIRLVSGGEAALVVDSFLPWRWGKGTAR